MSIILFFARLLAKLPTRLLSSLGTLLGVMLSRLASRRSCIVRTNLQLVFPSLSDEERGRIGKAHFAQLGRGLLEVLVIWFTTNQRSVLSLIRDARVTGLSYWQEKINQQGVILCVFHHTHMEAMGVLLGQLGEVHPVYRPQNNAQLEAISAQSRSRWTAGAVSNRQVKQMIRLLKQKKTLWLAPDQRNRGDGIPIMFMGHECLTHPSIARLARMTNSAIIPVICHQAPDGCLELAFKPTIDQISTKSDSEVLRELMLLLEQEVTQYPEQYFRVHDRFNIGDQTCSST